MARRRTPARDLASLRWHLGPRPARVDLERASEYAAGVLRTVWAAVELAAAQLNEERGGIPLR